MIAYESLDPHDSNGAARPVGGLDPDTIRYFFRVKEHKTSSFEVPIVEAMMTEANRRLFTFVGVYEHVRMSMSPSQASAFATDIKRRVRRIYDSATYHPPRDCYFHLPECSE